MVSIFVLLEKRGLCSSLVSFQKVAQPDADEPKTLLWTQRHSLSQLQCDIRQFLARGRSRVGCMAASEDLKLACFQFEHHGACYPRFLARSCPQFFRKSADHHLCFCQRYVVLKSILHGYRFCYPVREDFTPVHAPREVIQAPSSTAKSRCWLFA